MKKKKRQTWEKNRDVARQPRHGFHWCDVCDAQLVGAGSKCPVCGHKQVPKRYKK